MPTNNEAARPHRILEDYLGDGAYVYLSPSRNVVLYTSDGVIETNRVELEPDVLRSFDEWVVRMREWLSEYDAD